MHVVRPDVAIQLHRGLGEKKTLPVQCLRGCRGRFGEVSVKHESVKASAVGISKLTLLTFLGFDDLVWVKQTIGGRQKAYSVWLEWV